MDIEFNHYDWNINDLGNNFFSYRIYEDESGQHEGINKIFEKIDANFIGCVFLDVAEFSKYDFERNIKFRGCKFNEGFIRTNKINKKKIFFIDCNFFNTDIIFNADFEGILNINFCQNIKSLDISNSNFNKRVILTNLDLNDLTINNSNFKKNINLQNISVLNFNCQNTHFYDNANLSNSNFIEKVSFQNTIFEKNVNFRETNFTKEIDFSDVIFEAKTNFLQTKIKKVKNRETARIIKESFQNQSNIIESNKFYNLEMIEREGELKLFKNPFEWLIFKLHGISSNHSQSWILSLLWILYFGILDCFLKDYTYYYYDKYLFTITIFILTIIVFSISKSQIYKNIFLLFIVLISLEYVDLNYIANEINPFSIIPGNEKLTFGSMFFKITIAYLIYQLIISIRQNTRRS